MGKLDSQIIIPEIINIISLYLDPAIADSLIILPQTPLMGSIYGLDSLALLSIIVEIERRFDIEIPDEYMSLDFFSSAASIAEFVVELMED